MKEITGAADFLRIRRALEDVRVAGTITGDTREMPIVMSFAIAPRRLAKISRDLLKHVPGAITRLEEHEYTAMIQSACAECRKEFERDVLSRRAVVLHKGCVTYQHFSLRSGELQYVVHCRGMDVRKFLSDVRYVLDCAAEVCTTSLPRGYRVHLVSVRLLVDHFHCYLREDAPL